MWTRGVVFPPYITLIIQALLHVTQYKRESLMACLMEGNIHWVISGVFAKLPNSQIENQLLELSASISARFVATNIPTCTNTFLPRHVLDSWFTINHVVIHLQALQKSN